MTKDRSVTAYACTGVQTAGKSHGVLTLVATSCEIPLGLKTISCHAIAM